jgi:exonuclease VII large subunit
MRFNRASNQHYLFNLQRFEAIAKRLELCAFPEVLKRGFCIIMEGEAPITSVNQIKNPQKLTLHFQDGSVDGTFSQ